jgi:hypothetical protein
MSSRTISWVPGVLAAAVAAGVLVWLFVDSPSAELRSAPAASSRPKIDLASIEPPAYKPQERNIAISSASQAFSDAMQRYMQRDYSRASFGLRHATTLEPDNPEIRFFLGVSYLLTNDTRAGISELRVAERLGESPYLERVHYYLAKAFLKQKDTTNAMRELDATVQCGGSLADSARRLKFQLANAAQ